MIRFERSESGEDWPVPVMRLHPIPSKNMQQRRVRLEGRGAVWMYAHAAACAVSGGAKQVVVCQPHLLKPIRVFPLGERYSAHHWSDWIDIRRFAPRTWLVGFKPCCEEGGWPPAVLDQLRTRLQGLSARDRVVVQGPGAVWMYAAVAAIAAARAVSCIGCLMPTEGGIVDIWPESICGRVRRRCPTWHDPRAGIVLGIVGDPGSGKSVLARALGAACARGGICGWIYDCDRASPTPEWYLRMQGSNQRETAQKLRNANKRLWTRRLECEVARKLKQMRPYFDLLVADLPGGDHSTQPPQRIPKGREVIFNAVDRFIVLFRVDQPNAAQAWCAELRRIGRDQDILAVIGSAEPTSPPAGSLRRKGSRIIGKLSGLDRTHPTSHILRLIAPQLRLLLSEALDSPH